LHNADNNRSYSYCQMNTKYVFTVAAMAVMLIGATALATEDAFAGKKKYEKNQATSQANACGSPCSSNCDPGCCQLSVEIAHFQKL